MKKLIDFFKENFLGYGKEDIKAAFGEIFQKLKRPPKINNFDEFKKIKRFFKFLVLNALALLTLMIFSRPLALDLAEAGNIQPVLEIEGDSLDEDEDAEADFGLPFSLVKPPEDPERRLTRAEMRWIFLHETRLLAMRRVLSDENERAHRAYSAMAADFNVRGANYEYEFYEKKRAESDIEPYKEQIAEKAKEDALNWGWAEK